jgi:hypothetical protein
MSGSVAAAERMSSRIGVTTEATSVVRVPQLRMIVSGSVSRSRIASERW